LHQTALVSPLPHVHVCARCETEESPRKEKNCWSKNRCRFFSPHTTQVGQRLPCINGITDSVAASCGLTQSRNFCAAPSQGSPSRPTSRLHSQQILRFAIRLDATSFHDPTKPQAAQNKPESGLTGASLAWGCQSVALGGNLAHGTPARLRHQPTSSFNAPRSAERIGNPYCCRFCSALGV
jgi:hypothetical protein